jgi:ribosomal protein S12 methylthiotransferase accessory factor
MTLHAPLSLYRLRQTSSVRCGLMLPPGNVPTGHADIRGYYNWGVPPDPSNSWLPACGALAATNHDAEAGAIGETLERYCAGIARFPVFSADALPSDARRLSHDAFALYSAEQKASLGFLWPAEACCKGLYAQVFSLSTNETVWVPQELVGMGTREGPPTVPSTSSGLAAHTDGWLALLRAVQEILERDALTVTWLNSLGGRQFDLLETYQNQVADKGGEVLAFDLTQYWNPHPVVAVCGNIPLRGRPRFALGAACRETLELACEKAFQEWLQGVLFAGFHVYGEDRNTNASDIPGSFEEHAAYYSLHPENWPKVPLLRYRRPAEPHRTAAPQTDTSTILEALVAHLRQEDIELFYRELTTVDVRSTGLRVMRALSPQLSLLHGDERYPFLGGRTRDVGWRYPDLVASNNAMNPYPHPLG